MNPKKKRYLWLILPSVICACNFAVPYSSTAQKDQETGRKAIITREKEAMITLTQENDGGECRVRHGQIFQVILPENPTTGYRWTLVEPAPSEVTLVRQEYAAKSHDSSLIGAGGLRTMTFQAAGEGTIYLVLLLKRPWDKEGEHVDSFNLSLYIEE